MLDIHRNRFKGVENKIADIFAGLPLAPNHYTSLSIAFALAALYSMAAAEYFLALLLFAVAAFLDLIDGAVARKKGLATKRGAYWDTIADRYVEAIFFFGLLFCGLPDFYLSAAAWIFLALFGSTMTTYAKAAAKEKGLCDAELKGGLMSRGERLMVYFAIIILLSTNLDWAVAILAALAILSNFTALQRIYDALKSG